MSKQIVVIRNAGQYEGTLATLGSPVRATEYQGVQAAIRDIANVACLRQEEMVYAEAGNGGEYYVYRDQEECDADDSGASALAIVVTKAEYARERDDHGMWDASGNAVDA